jgi:hypothetical protein
VVGSLLLNFETAVQPWPEEQNSKLSDNKALQPTDAISGALVVNKTPAAHSAHLLPALVGHQRPVQKSNLKIFSDTPRFRPTRANGSNILPNQHRSALLLEIINFRIRSSQID